MAQILDLILNVDLGQQALFNYTRQNLPVAVHNLLGHETVSISSDHLFYITLLLLAHSVPFIGLNIFYHLFELVMPTKYESLRFQQGRHADTGLVLKGMLYTLLFHIVAPIAPLYLFASHLRSNPTLLDGPVPGVGKFFLQLVVCYLSTDVFFYWGHRLLHHPLLYARIHKQHHEFKVTVGWAAEYAHPLELLIGNVWPVISGVVLFKFHFSVQVVWTFIAMAGTTAAHSGVWYPSKTAGFHDFHHSHNIGNYGSLPFWDWLCGTDREYRKWQKLNGRTSAKKQ